MNKFSNQRGSITLYVLLSMLFFLIVTSAAFISMKTKETNQDREIARIKQSYEQREIKQEEKPKAGDAVSNPASYGPNAQATSDGKGRFFALPIGATYKEGTVDSGVVIEYKGSEFVWIPIDFENLTVIGKNGVPTDKKMAKLSTGTYAGTDDKGRPKYEGVLYDDNLNERIDYGQGTTSYREPADLQDVTNGDWSTTADRGLNLLIRHVDEYKGLENNSANQELIKTNWAKQLQEEYDAMIESVKKHGGFYVGRYETSIDIGSVKDAIQLSAGTEDGENELSWYGLYQSQKKFTTSSDYMVASMIWGSQYDAMLNWIQASESENSSYVNQTGHASHNYSEPQKSGKESSDIINNICDLEGNRCEWTLEAINKSYRVGRGGSYYLSNTPAYHGNTNVYGSICPYYTSTGHGSRITLYIK